MVRFRQKHKKKRAMSDYGGTNSQDSEATCRRKRASRYWRTTSSTGVPDPTGEFPPERDSWLPKEENEGARQSSNERDERPPSEASGRKSGLAEGTPRESANEGGNHPQRTMSLPHLGQSNPPQRQLAGRSFQHWRNERSPFPNGRGFSRRGRRAPLGKPPQGNNPWVAESDGEYLWHPQTEGYSSRGTELPSRAARGVIEQGGYYPPRPHTPERQIMTRNQRDRRHWSNRYSDYDGANPAEPVRTPPKLLKNKAASVRWEEHPGGISSTISDRRVRKWVERNGDGSTLSRFANGLRQRTTSHGGRNQPWGVRPPHRGAQGQILLHRSFLPATAD